MILLNLFFDSAGLNTDSDLPIWLIIAFAAMSIAVVCVLAWFISQKARGRISVKKENFYLGILITVIVSGFIGDGLQAVASMIFKSTSIWVMIPVYLLSYAALWVVGSIVFTKISKRSEVSVLENAEPDQ
ncbi:hypothetical protein [[Mycobacterium] vasticus]|uniref:Uncharacterized protein n=1 Tax=[Mycobacterium] vasticus TaxID=2875777 RepID=A0ABU5Z0E2_9MYCO|nr:hypothetical protein [Mycolicibacter sp. MYC017]MEB3070855.1 hypothetical protein [Mycolicibacter sp. MYC017]